MRDFRPRLFITRGHGCAIGASASTSSTSGQHPDSSSPANAPRERDAATLKPALLNGASIDRAATVPRWPYKQRPFMRRRDSGRRFQRIRYPNQCPQSTSDARARDY